MLPSDISKGVLTTKCDYQDFILVGIRFHTKALLLTKRGLVVIYGESSNNVILFVFGVAG